MDYSYSDEYFDTDRDEIIIHCYCEGHCPFGDDQGICAVQPGGQCFTSVEAATDGYGYEYPVLSYGCLPADEMALMQCKGSLVPHVESKSIECCNEGDFCNRNLFPMYSIEENPTHSDKLPFVILLSSLVCCLVIFVLVMSAVFLVYRKKNVDQQQIDENLRSETLEEGSGNDDSRGVEILDRGIEESASELPVMVQRTIAKQIDMERSISKGRFGEVWLARWRGGKIAVKVFFNTEKKSWLRETEVYQTVLMRHDNILGFIAADVKGSGSSTQLLVITDYHEHGSLFDFLQGHTLDPNSLLVMSRSIARGLAHLHTEILGVVHGKPTIAHRDIQSRNILVKNDGECCIADFKLAIKYRSNRNEIDIPTTEKAGTNRYLAPELLDNTFNLQNFDAHKMADIYALGLVFWEMTRRCVIENQEVLGYAMPYYMDVPNDPSVKDMQSVVCVRKIRPEIPEAWYSVDILKTITNTMKELWHDNPAVRLTALRVKKTLNKLNFAEEISININVNEMRTMKL